jgi:hypothetical protein
MAFTRQRLDRRRLDRPIDGHSVPIGSRLVLAALAGLALVLGACAIEEASSAAAPAEPGGSSVAIQDPAHPSPTRQAA